MVFDDLSELGSYLSDGFLMDELVTLLQKDNYELSEEELGLLEHSKNYLNLAKQGYNFYINRIYPIEDADMALNALKFIIKILIYNFNNTNFNINDIPNELKKFEDEIDMVIKERKIKIENVEHSLKLFKLISRKLLEESYKINERDKELIEL